MIDAYFSGTKLRWLLDNVPGARAAAERGELAFGTVDSWLIWQLTGGKRARHRRQQRLAHDAVQRPHATSGMRELLKALDIPASLMPEVQAVERALRPTPTPALLGAAMPIGGVAGDQQSALFGQACFEAGMAKNTYGTGCFLLMHTGARVPALAQRPAHDQRRADRRDAAVRDGRQRVRRRRGRAVAARRPARPSRAAAQVQALAESVPDAGGVMLVPAFTGLGAPYWDADARGTIIGLTRGTTVAHIARAALESIAYQSAALLQAMSRDAVAAGGAPVAELRVDGGACVNDLLMQFQADLLGIPVVRPAGDRDHGAGRRLPGRACRAACTATLDELAAQWQVERRFLPTMTREQAGELMARLGARGAAGDGALSTRRDNAGLRRGALGPAPFFTPRGSAMTSPMYTNSVPVFKQLLTALKTILATTAAEVAAKSMNADAFLQARLYPDMFPLVKQVQIACDFARGVSARLAGVDVPAHEGNETELRRSRRPAGHDARLHRRPGRRAASRAAKAARSCCAPARPRNASSAARPTCPTTACRSSSST